jgi:FkbM family methyltransferase
MIKLGGTIGNEYNFYSKIEPELKLIIDVGAQNSFFTNVNCEIHFFEPDTVAFNELIKNTNEKYFFNKKGLGIENQEKILYNDLGSVYHRHVNGINYDVNEKIEIIRLDLYITEKNIKNISLLKIDTEGMEYEILSGMGEYLDICKYIVFEYAWDTAEAAGVNFSNIKSLLDGFDLFEMGSGGELINLDEEKITKRVRPNTNNIVAKNKKSE